MVKPNLLLSAGLLGMAVGRIIPRIVPLPLGPPTVSAGSTALSGSPTPGAQGELDIAREALGKLPNAPHDTSLGAGTTTAFQLIAFNELFEVAFFSSLLNNITHGVPGYNASREDAHVIRVALAQEKQHALGAIATLKAAGAFAPTQCKYRYPATTFREAILVAEIQTSLVMGALQDANVLFTKDGAAGPVRIVSSVIGQEGEQNGYYRLLLRLIPPESPFLTTVPGAFAYSALQNYVVPGSCPYPLSNIHLPIFPPILTNGRPMALVPPQDQILTFEANLKGSNSSANSSAAASRHLGGDGRGLFLTYTNGQQLPFSVPLRDVKWQGTTINFQAEFPYEERIMGGLTHGALTTGGNFTGPDAVVDAALAGPAIIQVENRI